MDRRNEGRKKRGLNGSLQMILFKDIHKIKFSIWQVMLVPLMGKTACSCRKLQVYSFKRLSCFIKMPKQCWLAEIQAFD